MLQELKNHDLSPSPEASRQTLIRRLYFDLIGLPPSIEEVRSFLADSDPKAYDHLVDRLLASPAYGERWARHWLDIVHFGETHGYDKDKPRPNAWPYRDYVIRAFNSDKPYSRFVQEQIAGDVLFPDTRDGIEALGFVSAGPWDFIGHEEVPETKIDGRIARHLDRDDMVSNTLQTFNSLTIQCAQCHNHKFDPISSEEYYQLQAVFAAVDRTNLKYDTDPVVAGNRKRLMDEKQASADKRRALVEVVQGREKDRFKTLDDSIDRAEKTDKQRSAFGYHSQISSGISEEKWVQIDLGKTTPILSVTLHACRDDFNNIGDGFGFPSRYKVEASEDPEFKEKVFLLADRTAVDQANPALQPVVLMSAGSSNPILARHLRVTATRLAHRKDDYIFALAELEVFSTNGTNVALKRPVSAKDSVDAPPRWAKVNLTDGWWPGASTGEDQGRSLASLKQEREVLFKKLQSPQEADQLTKLEATETAASKQLAALPPQSTAYVAAVHKGSGAFMGTGGKGGKPRPIHVLSRGNILKPGEEVGPAALKAIKGPDFDFHLPPEHKEGDRRAALTKWLTDARHPLTWRSIVNRIWQYHFGRGLVETPSDFGRMGSQPSHPALLDWLACEFRDGGQSMKAMHKLIVTSQTYRQESRGSAAFTKIDSDNRWLWRMNRRKLEAETIRDAMLVSAGSLDPRMYGPSFQDFVVEKPEHSPHYEYHLHDPEDPKALRRSVYRFLVRSQPQPFMAVLDCADPSMQVARRNESLSPLQSLSMLNNALVLSLSKKCATRAAKGGPTVAEQVRRAHTFILSREPTISENQLLADYAQVHGLENVCRLLFNVNEFMFVD